MHFADLTEMMAVNCKGYGQWQQSRAFANSPQKQFPILVSFKFLEFGDMFLKLVFIERFSKQTIIPFMKRNTVIVYPAFNINLPVQMPIAFAAV